MLIPVKQVLLLLNSCSKLCLLIVFAETQQIKTFQNDEAAFTFFPCEGTLKMEAITGGESPLSTSKSSRSLVGSYHFLPVSKSSSEMAVPWKKRNDISARDENDGVFVGHLTIISTRFVISLVSFSSYIHRKDCEVNKKGVFVWST